jgi:fatty-acyl-CoA synthase
VNLQRNPQSETHTRIHGTYQTPDWLQKRAELSPQRVALIDTLDQNRSITFGEWNRKANRTAHFLRANLGVRKGDLVAVLAKNCVEYLDIWFALAKLGGVLQTLNWRLTPHELGQMLSDSPPVALVYDSSRDNTQELGRTVRSLRRQLPSSIRFVSMSEPLDPDDLSFSLRDTYPDTLPPVPNLSLEDPWVICYTGGTTGLPKGAILSYRAVTANAINTVISWGLTSQDVTVLNSPLFHSGGLNVFTAPLVYIGGASIVCQEFDLEQTFDLLDQGQVSIWFGVPTMFVMMQNHPRWKNSDFSHLKILISGGAPCPLPVFERFWDKGIDFKTGYGLTEAGPNTFWLPPEQVRQKPGAVGYPLFHVEVRLVGEAGDTLGPGEVGELLIRGPHVFSGYLNNPAATAGVLKDGWLHTGDLASYDPDGCFRIMGRLKDMIISGGENIYPSEIENVLHALPDVVEAAVIGIPDEKWGEVGWAILFIKPGASASETALADYCSERLARFKIPKRFILVNQPLPKTGANKVDKKALAEMYRKGERT